MTMTLPLLHAGDTLRSTIEVDRLATALGLLVFTFVGAWLWRAELHTAVASLAHRRPRRRLATIAFGVLVLLAMVPTILPYDHLFDGGHDDGHASVHAAHCHDSTPGDCADAPVTSGPGQFIAADPLLVAPVMLSVLLIVAVPLLRGISQRPEIRPPLSPLAA